MNKTKVFLLVGCICLLVGCSKSKVTYIQSLDEINRLSIEEIIKDKKMTLEAKSQAIQIKMAEQMERKKRVVESEKDAKLSSIINRPVTPLRTPDTVLRVLMLPYEDSNGTLNSWKYSFIKVEDGKWVLSDYLNSSVPKTNMSFTPLDKLDRNSDGE